MKILIFATTYVDTPDKQKLLFQWAKLHRTRNPDCDFLLVDSASPLALPPGIDTFRFHDNVGHLSRGGRDGFGRAFCWGLDHATAGKWDYVFHVEGDSLLRTPVETVAFAMKALNQPVASMPVVGAWGDDKQDWIETACIGFSTDWLMLSNFVERYAWEKRTLEPEPERHVASICKTKATIGRGARNDTGLVTLDNIGEWDWITHCSPELCDRFLDVNLAS